MGHQEKNSHLSKNSIPTKSINDQKLQYLTADVFVTCPGTPGHGSLMLPDTAGEKVEIIINKFMDLRRREKKKLESNKNLTVGDVTSVNLTQIKVSARFINLFRETLTLTT